LKIEERKKRRRKKIKKNKKRKRNQLLTPLSSLDLQNISLCSFVITFHNISAIPIFIV